MTFDDMTPEWLTGVLQPGAVTACAWERIGEEQGFSSTLARFTLTGTDVPRTLVAKCPATENEVRSYREFAGRAPLAKCYAGSAGEYLLLEDVAGRVGDAVAGCSANDAATVLRAMAALHTDSWAHAPVWPRRIGGDPAGAQANHERRAPVFLERYGDRLPRAHRALLERLRPRYGALLARMARAPTTLLHSDLHLDNVIFGDGVVFLDWENPGVGRAAFDVAWFLYPALATDERRRHEDALLGEYHAHLQVAGYPYEAFCNDLDAALAVLTGACMNGIARIDPETCHPRQSEWVDEFLGPGRVLQAAADRGVERLFR